MITLPYDESHHLTGFEFLFSDGEIRPAFLLSGLATFIDRTPRRRDLDRWRLREGYHYEVVNTSDLVSIVPTSTMELGFHPGNRIVLSYEGLLRVVLRGGNTEFSERLMDWVTGEVLPAILRDGFYRASEVDEIVQELRTEIDQLRRMIDLGFGDMTLGDMVGWDD